MNRIRKYWGEVVLELRKATWPWDLTQKGFARFKELTDATTVVFVAMVMLAAFTGTFDFLLRKCFEAFLTF